MKSKYITRLFEKMNMKEYTLPHKFLKLFLILLLGLLTTQCNSDFLIPKTAKSGIKISFDNVDVANSVAATNDGGVIIAGSAGTNAVSDSLTFDQSSDVLLLKTTDKGEVLWHKTYTFGYAEVATDVKVTNDGGYIVVGNLTTLNHESDIILLKTDAQGNIIWTRRFSRGFYNKSHALIKATNGNYVIIGTTHYEKTSKSRVLVLDYTPNGSLNWTSIINDTSGKDTLIQQGNDIKEIQDGFILTGVSKKSPDSTNTDALLMKISSSGHYDWSRTFGGATYVAGVSVVRANDGYVIGANVNDIEAPNEINGSFFSEGQIIKTDFKGNEMWSKYAGGDKLYQLIKSIDGDYLIAGYIDSHDETHENAYYEQTDIEGNINIRKSYNYDTFDYGHALTELKTGKVIMVGTTGNTNGIGIYFVQI